MGRMDYLAMKTDEGATTSTTATDLIKSDLKEIGNAAKRLLTHATRLGSLGLGTTILEWIASFAAIYLLILDRTNWRTNMLTTLLLPYIFFSLPSLLFNIFSGQVGKWIAFIAVIWRLFFPSRFPNWLEMPAALILMLVVAPSLFSDTFRDSWVGVVVCLIIGCYLLQEHIRATGGFRNSFAQAHGISNTLGLIVLLVYPIWALVLDIL
ncbi:Cold-regulated 413 protein [Dillenia turbinata]|uniref:Cold-regulated 413 protein n=1 Tax=Dillenia turbinata TaxID=194707 RepID=A0AAN8UR87_9MAGN